MGEKKQSGFTIIETSMFLAISALLFVGLISGVSVTINRQRYVDSVQSTYSFLQKQFNETLNVVNNRPKAQDCPLVPAEQKIKGASEECLVLGKLITFNLNSDKITTRSIIGFEPDPDPAVVINSIEDFSPTIKSGDNNQEEYSIPWSSSVFVSKRKGPSAYNPIDSVAIIRSPVDGTTSVFAFNGADTSIVDNNGKIHNLDNFKITPDSPAIICIKSPDILTSRSMFKFDGVGSQDGLTLKSDAQDTPAQCGEL